MKTQTKMAHLLRTCLAVLLLSVGTSSAFAAKGGNGKPGGGGGDADTVSPAAIGDLSAANSGGSAPFFTLSWTAVGDDGTDGTANSYDMRFIVGGVLDETSWETAAQIQSVPSPDESGTSQVAIPYDLPFESTCQIGVKVVDEAGNESLLSNVVTVTMQSHTWKIVNVAANYGSGGGGRKLATAPDGTQGIVFVAWLENLLYFAERPPSGGDWSAPVVVVSERDRINIDGFEYDPAGEPSFLYHSNGETILARRQSVGWQFQTFLDNYEGGNTLAYDPLGEPWVGYGAEIGKGKKAVDVLKVAGWDSAAQIWDTDVVDPDGFVSRSSMAFGPSGPVLAYRVIVDTSDSVNETNNRFDVRFAEWNVTSGSWDSITLPGGIGGFGPDVSIAVNPVTGLPAVAFSDDSYAIHFLQQNSDGSWDSELIPAIGRAGNLVFHPSGVPYLPLIVETSEGLRNLKLAHKSSGAWEVELVVPMTRTYYPLDKPSLAISQTGIPTISADYLGAATLIYAERIDSLD